MKQARQQNFLTASINLTLPKAKCVYLFARNGSQTHTRPNTPTKHKKRTTPKTPPKPLSLMACILPPATFAWIYYRNANIQTYEALAIAHKYTFLYILKYMLSFVRTKYFHSNRKFGRSRGCVSDNGAFVAYRRKFIHHLLPSASSSIWLPKE